MCNCQLYLDNRQGDTCALQSPVRGHVHCSAAYQIDTRAVAWGCTCPLVSDPPVGRPVPG